MKLCVCGHSIIAHDNCEECLEDECECDSYEPRVRYTLPTKERKRKV